MKQGTRVIVYSNGSDRKFGPSTIHCLARKGTVVDIIQYGFIVIEWDDDGFKPKEYIAHPKQARILKPKAARALLQETTQ